MKKYKVTVIGSKEQRYVFIAKNTEIAETKAKELFRNYTAGTYDSIDVIELREVKE